MVDTMFSISCHLYCISNYLKSILLAPTSHQDWVPSLQSLIKCYFKNFQVGLVSLVKGLAWLELIFSLWLPDWLKNFLQLGALIRAHWFPQLTNKCIRIGSSYESSLIPQLTLKTACNWELFSELIDSPINKQTYCDWELLSEIFDLPSDH